MSLVFRRWLNYYTLFPKTLAAGPPPKGPFNIDLRALRTEYLKAQQQAHPDVAQGGPESVDSATLGSAYRTLCDPLLRAQHILDLNGISSIGEDANLDDEELLMNILMIREEAAECDDPQECQELAIKNQERITSTVQRLEAALARGDFPSAKKATVELSYWKKLDSELQKQD